MRPILKGSTDQSVVIRIVDSADGTPETGVTSATGGLALYYRREGATRTALTALNDLANAGSAHTDGGIVHIGDGYYRVDPQDAAFASGVNGVLIEGTATGMVVIGAYHPLYDLNPYDPVRAGLTSLPNAAAEASGGLPTLSAAQASNGTIQANVHRWLTGTPNALQSGRVDSYVGAMVDGLLTAAKFAAGAFDAVWTVATRVLTAGTNIALAKGTGVTGFTDIDAAGVRSALGMSAADLDAQLAALPTAAENATALLDLSSGVETSITPRQALRLILAASAGKLSGAATTTITIRNVGDTADRITATVDASGNRTAVTVNGS